MDNSDTSGDSELLFWFQNQKQNQNQNHTHELRASCWPPTSPSALYGSSSISNTGTSTGDEDVCESYKVREMNKKRKLTPIQLRLLEECFEEEKRLEPDKKLWLAEKLGLQSNQVAVWFQNRRAKLKSKQLQEDCDSLKANYAKLKADWDILSLQNETLKNKVALLKEKLRMQEHLETQSHYIGQIIELEADELGKQGSPVVSEEEEEGNGNHYSFPELAILGYYYDPTMTASNLSL